MDSFRLAKLSSCFHLMVITVYCRERNTLWYSIYFIEDFLHFIGIPSFPHFVYRNCFTQSKGARRQTSYLIKTIQTGQRYRTLDILTKNPWSVTLTTRLRLAQVFLIKYILFTSCVYLKSNITTSIWYYITRITVVNIKSYEKLGSNETKPGDWTACRHLLQHDYWCLSNVNSGFPKHPLTSI